MVDLVTTLASVKLRLMLDISVDSLVDMVDMVVIVTLASVRLRLMLDISVDTMVDMVDMLATVDTLVDIVATVDTLDKLLNIRTIKKLLSPIKMHNCFFEIKKLGKKA